MKIQTYKMQKTNYISTRSAELPATPRLKSTEMLKLWRDSSTYASCTLLELNEKTWLLMWNFATGWWTQRGMKTLYGNSRQLELILDKIVSILEGLTILLLIQIQDQTIDYRSRNSSNSHTCCQDVNSLL